MIQAVNLEQIQKLREKTGVSIMACKKALIASRGNLAEAEKVLKKEGKQFAEKKSNRATYKGLIEAYIHSNGKIGALIEVHCETDFVVKNTDFKKLCHELVLQVAGYNPLYIAEDQIPKKDLAAQKKIFNDDFINQGLGGERLKKATASKLERFKQENCLLSQLYFRDPQKKISDLIEEAIRKIGENIKVERFIRYEI